MADDINDDAVRRLKQEAELRKKIAESSAEYLVLLKDIKAIHKNIATVEAEHAKKTAIVKDLQEKIKTATGQELDDLTKILALEKAKEGILKKQVSDLKESAAMMTKIAKETDKTTKSFAFLGQTAKDVGSITRTVKKGYGLLKNWAGLFEIDKSIRMASLSMGLLDKRGQGFRDTLKAAGDNTIKFGVGIKELAQLQASFSEELGRSVLLSQQGLEALGAMSAASNLGAEGAAKMTAEMEQQGYSAERTRDFVEQTMNDASKMGLNASKVIKNVQQNMKLLNKYNFKGGVKGLAKMAETTSKLGIDMNSVAGMADKLFDIEGAVDMSAQLQVMGGAWAQLADPFHLMYMARNDMAGLTEEMGKAAESSATFDVESKTFKISAMEMHKLRKIAEQTSVSYDELAAAAKGAARATAIKKQMNFGLANDSKFKDVKEFIQNTAEFNNKGEAVIQLKSGPKLVKDLSKLDGETIKQMMEEKKTLEQRAKDSQSFDETITNLINQFKQLLLPLVETLSDSLKPVVDRLAALLSSDFIKNGIKTVAEKLGEVLKWAKDNPITAIVGAIAGIGLFEYFKWYKNGKALGYGFNSVANAGGGGSGNDSIDNMTRGKKGKSQFAGGSFSKGKKIAAKGGGRGVTSFLAGNAGKMLGGAGAGVVSGAIDSVGAFSEGNTGEGIGNIAGGILGGAVGTLLDPFIGPLGTMIGAQLGSMAGGYIGGLFDDKEGEEAQPTRMHDGIIFNQRDKFLKMNDGAMIAGTNVNGNKDLAKAITNQSGVSAPSSMKIEFGEIKFDGEIKLSLPGNQTMSLDLRKDPIFMRDLTKIVHTETVKAINGGKVKP